MRTKDVGEQLLDTLGSGEIGEAYQLAGQVVYELDEAKERAARLEVAIRRMVEAGGRAEFQREFDAAKSILRDATLAGTGVES